nr:hypothetical protein [Clostridiales bacterium]
IKTKQLDSAGFGDWGESAESASQVIMGLCCIGIDPCSSEFKKGENTMLTNLSTFINEDGGARCYDGTSNIMTGYQMLCALASYSRFTKGMPGVYDMSRQDEVCAKIIGSWIGQHIPFLAKILCAVVRGFYNAIDKVTSIF